ncbi:MAG: riboflavin synthase subunit alpha [Myxococcota bacterium]
MFTGIVQGTATVRSIEDHGGIRRLRLEFPEGATNGLAQGASVSIAGVCLTVVDQGDHDVAFDVIDETLRLTTLAALTEGAQVNFERAAKFGDEVGGHFVSGHIFGMGEVVTRTQEGENLALVIRTSVEVMPYVLEKGYLAVDGCSLTIGAVDRDARTFGLHLIPETRAVTTLGDLNQGDTVNLEVDATTQAVVATVERVMKERGQ